MQSSKQGTEKGHHLSIEGIRNIIGTFFAKNRIQKGKELDLRVKPP